MGRIPANLPPFLEDTPASAQLRIAYVESIISDIITRKIFEPFLFIRSRYDEDLIEWSDYIRRKSTRREAYWRQRTLFAAFSCPSSKNRINEYARRVIDEILKEINPFANQGSLEQMAAAVRQVVKCAAETWRFARIELARIVAKVAGSVNPAQEVLLTLFPHIEREPKHEDLHPRAKKNDLGCTYSVGSVLTSSSPIVLARRVELGEIAQMPGDASVTAANDGQRLKFRRTTSAPLRITVSSRGEQPRPISPLIAPKHTEPQRELGDASSIPADEISGNRKEVEVKSEPPKDTHHQSHSTLTPNEGEEQGTEEDSAIANEEENTTPTAEPHSPLQSPAQSHRAESPSLSRQSTGRSMSSEASSLTDDEEDSQTTAKPAGTIPEWGSSKTNEPGTSPPRDEGGLQK